MIQFRGFKPGMPHRVQHLLFESGLLLLTLSSTTAFAEKWQNPSERYQDAYKQYSEARCPLPKDSIHHYVYFARDRDAVREHPLLTTAQIEGAQIMYAWAELEPKKDHYDFSRIISDRDYLAKHGKKLFVQLQDATFHPKYKAVPSYLLTDEYAGGAVDQWDDAGKPEGWVAKRWNVKVQQRFAALLNAMGRELDGKIAGINLQETSIGVSAEKVADFSPQHYALAIQANMLALKQAFPQSVTLQYANFMPGEWLPWEDEGYLRGVYTYGEKIGVGLGAPDLLVKRKGQLNHALAMMHERQYTVPLGIAVQDGNYVGVTGSQKGEAKGNLVPLLHGFASDFLKVDYMFWVNQEPYFEKNFLACLVTPPEVKGD